MRRWRIRGSAGHLTSRLWSSLRAWQLPGRFKKPPELLASTWVARALPRRHAQATTSRGQASSKARQWPCSPAAPRPRGVCFKLGARVCTVPVRALAHRMRPNKSLNSTTSGMPARGAAQASRRLIFLRGPWLACRWWRVSSNVRPHMHALVVVSGLPASGKTTLAKRIARELAAPHFDKDDFLEALFESEGVASPEQRRALSRRADAEFQSQALAHPPAVLSSWWHHPASKHDTGTPAFWLKMPHLLVVEVHCQCSGEEAASRFVGRRRRHPGHFDSLRRLSELMDEFKEAEAMGPLDPTTAIVSNTSTHVSAAAIFTLLHQVRLQLATGEA